MSKHRKVPSPALVISLIALFVALGSGAYAASKIGTSDLKRNAVTTPKLAKDAVKSSKVENGKLKGKDLADGTVGGSKLGTISEVTDTTTAAFGTSGPLRRTARRGRGSSAAASTRTAIRPTRASRSRAGGLATAGGRASIPVPATALRPATR